MKKILRLFFCTLLLISLIGCSAKNSTPENDTGTEETAALSDEEMAAAIKELSGNYMLTSFLSNDEELITEELQETLNLFKENNPLMELAEGIHYSYIEEGDTYYMDVLFVAPQNYHYFRMWCPASDREKYEDIMYDLMENHVFIREYYQ